MKQKSRIKDINSTGDIIFQICNNAFLGMFAFICFYPFYYIIINTVSANDLVDRGTVLFWVQGFHLTNYVNVFKMNRIADAALVSLARTVIGTIGSVFTSAYMGYLFSKQKVWGHSFWYRFTVVTMYFSAGTIPIYLNIKLLGLLNTFWVYVIPGLFPVFSMILVKTFWESISPSLEEAAEIDGAGYFRRFIQIMLPLSVPVLATITLFSAVAQWNAYVDTLLYIQDYHLYSLQFLLQMYFRQASSLSILAMEGKIDISTMLTPTAIRLTVTVVVTLPVICLYPFIQRFYVKGIMLGAIKG